jgi:hypothetical protein
MREDVRQESPRTHPRESSFVSLMSGWAQQGIQSYFATQRILVDLAMRQPSNVMNTLKDRLSDPRHSAAAILTELADEGISNFVDAQRVLLDLAQRQNEIVTTHVKGRIPDSSAVVAMTELLRCRVDTVIEMQREFLKIAGKQTRTWVEDAKTGKAPKSTAVVDLAREAMENFVSAEKKFLDAVAEETQNALRKKPGKSPDKFKRSDLADLGRRATESFIEAQKEMVDVAGRQMNANLKTASRTMDILRPLPVLPLSEWTREGVQSFVDAQKALMDAVTKPGNGFKPAPKGRRAANPMRDTRPKVAH